MKLKYIHWDVKLFIHPSLIINQTQQEVFRQKGTTQPAANKYFRKEQFNALSHDGCFSTQIEKVGE